MFLKGCSFEIMCVCFSGDLLVNPDQPRLTIPIAQIAPDLILADLPRNIMLNNDELEFQQAPEFLLGKRSSCWCWSENTAHLLEILEMCTIILELHKCLVSWYCRAVLPWCFTGTAVFHSNIMLQL